MTTLLAHGAQLDAKATDGSTALHHALQWGQTECITLLLERGIDPNVRDNRGRTPIFWAIGSQASKANIQQMLAKGADINTRSNEGKTPLGEAMARGTKQSVAMFKELGGTE